MSQAPKTTASIAVLVMLMSTSVTEARDRATETRLTASIKGKYMAVISDGDFRAQTYADGKLPPVGPAYRDTLTIVPLSGPNAGQATSLYVPNSVVATPDVLALSPDGRFAYVIDMVTRPVGAETRAQMRPGNTLTIVDLTDPAKPKVTETVTVANGPESVKVSSDGTMVAIATNPSDREVIQIIQVKDGLAVGPLQTFTLAELGVPVVEGRPKGGIDASFVDWHPSARVIAVNLYARGQVVFFRVERSADGRVSLIPWGAPVDAGPDPFTARFSTDGAHYIVSNWGRNFAATTLDERLPSGPGRVTSIRLGRPEGDGKDHAVVGSADVGNSPEGIAISPDGKLLATINMRGTIRASSSPHYTAKSSVTLLSFDPSSGKPTRIADYELDGVLPEGGTFDATGEHFLATAYEYRGQSTPGGGIEVFRVVKTGNATKLERAGRIAMPHGAHHVEIGR
jgi:DNA-binding beta-propeller fold protein YncE